MNTLRIPTSNRGYVSQYVWGAIWIALLVALSYWCSATLADIQLKLNGRYRSEGQEITMIALYGSTYLSLIIAGIIAWVNMSTSLYDSRKVHTFFKDAKGKWNKVRSESYGFPFSTRLQDQLFDRITNIDVTQSMIDRIMGTGTIALEMTTYKNADSEEFTWTILAVTDPYGLKAQIEADMMAYDGLSVKISDR